KEPLQFVQGRRMVIAGWEAGFEGMRVGGKRRLFIPYQMAYGELGQGKIPPKSELIFDVELLGVSDAPPPPPAADILMSFSESEAKVMALAKAIPEDKYAWRPAPGIRSFSEVFAHIASGNLLMLKLATAPPQKEELKTLIEAQVKKEKETYTKDQV